MEVRRGYLYRHADDFTASILNSKSVASPHTNANANANSLAARQNAASANTNSTNNDNRNQRTTYSSEGEGKERAKSAVITNVTSHKSPTLITSSASAPSDYFWLDSINFFFRLCCCCCHAKSTTLQYSFAQTDWKRVYCVVQNWALHFYASSNDIHPFDTVSLYGAAVVFIRYPKVPSDHINAIEVVTSTRNLYLSMDESEDCRLWALAIQKNALLATGANLNEHRATHRHFNEETKSNHAYKQIETVSVDLSREVVDQAMKNMSTQDQKLDEKEPDETKYDKRRQEQILDVKEEEKNTIDDDSKDQDG